MGTSTISVVRQAPRSVPEDIFGRISSALQSRYGLEVIVCESDYASDSATEFANLREGVVRLSPSRSPEQQGFILAHVFGHLVQHRYAPKHRSLIALVESPPPIAFSPAQERAYYAFEMEASAWGEALMRTCMPVSPGLLHRFKAYVMTDFTSYLSYLKTGIQTHPAEFQRDFTRRVAGRIDTLWDSSDLSLPASLSVEDVNISIL